MQVEVSKFTEGLNDKTLRPNALPVSLIHYDGEQTHQIHSKYWKKLICWIWQLFASARQKEKALSSITEVVQTVQHPRSHSQVADEFVAKLDEHEKFYVDSPLQKSSDIKNLKSPGRLTPLRDAKCESPRRSIRKSGLSSLIGWVHHLLASECQNGEKM